MGLDGAELLERVRLVRVSPTFGFAEIRLLAANLHSLKVELDSCGRLRLTAPTRTDKHGRTWPAYSLQPGAAEEIERAIARLWHGPDGR